MTKSSNYRTAPSSAISSGPQIEDQSRGAGEPGRSALMKFSATIVLSGAFVVFLATVAQAQQQPAQVGSVPRHGPTNVVATLRDEAAWEAVMRHLIPMYQQILPPTSGHTNVADLSSITNRVFYISVADGDPSDGLLAKLKAIEPKQTLKKLSERPTHISDPRLGKDDLILKVGRIRWTSETTGVLSAGHYMGALSESGMEFLVGGKGDTWMAMPTGNMWVR